MGALKNLTGQRFGMLVVIKRLPNSKRGDARWLCKCDCGNESSPWGKSLLAGTTSSCGCRKGYGGSWKSHGMSGMKVYRAWKAMKARITNSRHPRHKRDYQDRGIKIHAEWMNSFEAFYAHIGDPPGPEYSLDRINNDGDYVPGNIRWATRGEQQRNKRSFKRS